MELKLQITNVKWKLNSNCNLIPHHSNAVQQPYKRYCDLGVLFHSAVCVVYAGWILCLDTAPTRRERERVLQNPKQTSLHIGRARNCHSVQNIPLAFIYLNINCTVWPGILPIFSFSMQVAFESDKVSSVSFSVIIIIIINFYSNFRTISGSKYQFGLRHNTIAQNGETPFLIFIVIIESHQHQHFRTLILRERLQFLHCHK